MRREDKIEAGQDNNYAEQDLRAVFVWRSVYHDFCCAVLENRYCDVVVNNIIRIGLVVEFFNLS